MLRVRAAVATEVVDAVEAAEAARVKGALGDKEQK
jgi:hypothetical protein